MTPFEKIWHGNHCMVFIWVTSVTKYLWVLNLQSISFFFFNPKAIFLFSFVRLWKLFHVFLMERLGWFAVQISEIYDFHFGSKNRSHRTSTFATSWAAKKASRNCKGGKAKTRALCFPKQAPSEREVMER